jgi:release factor glutamine methyltransferase
MEDPIPHTDLEALVREKYGGNRSAVLESDLKRLRAGEPLAYVLGSQPFLGLSIGLASRPLVPRPETEWWTELLVERINDRLMHHGQNTTIPSRVLPVRVLDMCAGSGAIGLAVLKHCPNAHVSFGELEPEHATLIAQNIKENKLPEERANVRVGDLFAPFSGERFDIIATNPPYIPDTRELPPSVRDFEPARALFAGTDGLSVIRRICDDVSAHVSIGGELWMECDIENIEEAKRLVERTASHTEIRTDQYGRPRLIVGYYGNGRRFSGSGF